jgi:hypothetical protein
MAPRYACGPSATVLIHCPPPNQLWISNRDQSARWQSMSSNASGDTATTGRPTTLPVRPADRSITDNDTWKSTPATFAAPERN